MPLAEPSVFSGLAALRVAPPSRLLSLLRTGKSLVKPTLSAVDGSHPKHLLPSCQFRFSVQTLNLESAFTGVANLLHGDRLVNGWSNFPQAPTT